MMFEFETIAMLLRRHALAAQGARERHYQ